LLLGVISAQAVPTVTNTLDAGAGSLRQAILAATAGSTIDFAIPTSDPGYDPTTNRFTIALASSLPVIAITVTIDNFPTTARGVTVRGNNTFRIFTLANSAVVTINNLTISHGTSNGALDFAKGGGIFMGNSAVLTLNNCIVSNNTATNGGGGIWMNDSAVLHVFDSTISNNTTTGGDGGGIRIFNSGTLNITRSTVSGNQATATAPAGGGGGIYNGVAGTVNATNITVSGNTAGNQGGGINTSATLNVSSSTIAGNTAAIGGGGIFNGPTFTATLGNSLVALNTVAPGPDLRGTFTANYCLIGNADGSTISGANNQLGTTAVPINPLLGPLQNNGGPTFTRALLAGSPAIDTGFTALATDQRGFMRPYDFPLIPNAPGGNGSDIGAFERQANDVGPKSRADFDGDGRTDLSVFRPSEGNWYLNRSTAGFSVITFGISTDTLVPGDYDNDGKADTAVFRPDANSANPDYYVLNSNGFVYRGVSWGVPGDIPVNGDYDGDSKTDFAVFRPSTGIWYILNSSNGSNTIEPFGLTGDVPLAIDNNADGKTNLAVFRPSNNTWYIARPTGTPATNFDAVRFGLAGDLPVPADYDNDNKEDVAMFRPSNGTWYILRSTNGVTQITAFGISTDIPVPGDYDGDGADDIAVYRGGTWYVNRSTSGLLIQAFGLGSDRAIPKAYIP